MNMLVRKAFVLGVLVLGTIALAAPGAAQAASCSGLQIVYVRGTFEPTTPYGTVLGDQLVSDMQKDVAGTTAEGISYPASLGSTSPTQGNTTLVNYVTSEAAACPSQKLVLAGYSQGANVVAMSFGLNTSKAVVGGASVAQIPAALDSHITAVLMFGPPYNQVGLSVPAPFSAITDQFCASGDAFCSTNPNGLGGVVTHLTDYQADLAPAAQYAASNYAHGIVA
jgi:cutinase